MVKFKQPMIVFTESEKGKNLRDGVKKFKESTENYPDNLGRITGFEASSTIRSAMDEYILREKVLETDPITGVYKTLSEEELEIAVPKFAELIYWMSLALYKDIPLEQELKREAYDFIKERWVVLSSRIPAYSNYIHHLNTKLSKNSIEIAESHQMMDYGKIVAQFER